MASSGFWNWAAAGRLASRPVAAIVAAQEQSFHAFPPMNNAWGRRTGCPRSGRPDRPTHRQCTERGLLYSQALRLPRWIAPRAPLVRRSAGRAAVCLPPRMPGRAPGPGATVCGAFGYRRWPCHDPWPGARARLHDGQPFARHAQGAGLGLADAALSLVAAGRGGGPVHHRQGGWQRDQRAHPSWVCWWGPCWYFAWCGGLIGGRWSRFASFVKGPGAVLRYLRGQHQPGDWFQRGPQPAGWPAQ